MNTNLKRIFINKYVKYLLILFDKIICTLNTKNFADSESQANLLNTTLKLNRNKVSVIAHGCFGGINFSRFDFKLFNS